MTLLEALNQNSTDIAEDIETYNVQKKSSDNKEKKDDRNERR